MKKLELACAGLAALLAVPGCSSDPRAPAAMPPPRDSVISDVEPEAQPRLTHGPMVAAVTADSARIWLRAAPSAHVQIQYARVDGKGETLRSTVIATTAQTDYTATVELTGLAEGTAYAYRILVADEDQTPSTGPTFRTFQAEAGSVRIGLLADFVALDDREAPAFQALARDDPDFVLIVGDWDHRNVTDLGAMRAMHRETRGGETIAGASFRDQILSRFPVAYVWDDHDFGTNNSDKTFPAREEAIRAYDEYWPSYARPAPKDGIWHKFGYGGLVEVFMLDLRSQRDPDSYQDPRFVSDRQPGANRLELRMDPERSMLDGDERPEGRARGQKDWLLNGLRSSTAPWKVVVSTVPLNPTVRKDDTWWDFLAEQRELVAFVRDQGLTGVLVVSGDLHTGGAIDDGRNSGLPELSLAPVNTPFSRTCWLHQVPGQREPGSCGDWSEGMRPRGFGYGLLTLDRGSARLEARDEAGAVVRHLRLQTAGD